MHGEIHKNDAECVQNAVDLILKNALEAREDGFEPTIYVDLDSKGWFKVGYAVPFIGKVEKDNRASSSEWIRRKMIRDSFGNAELNLTKWECVIEGQLKDANSVEYIRDLVYQEAGSTRFEFSINF